MPGSSKLIRRRLARLKALGQPIGRPRKVAVAPAIAAAPLSDEDFDLRTVNYDRVALSHEERAVELEQQIAACRQRYSEDKETRRRLYVIELGALQRAKRQADRKAKRWRKAKTVSLGELVARAGAKRKRRDAT